MIILCNAVDVSNLWPLVKENLPLVSKELEMLSQQHLNNILNSLMAGTSQLWSILDEDETFKGFAITECQVSKIDNRKNLFIYALYASEQLSRRDVIDGMRVLDTFALNQGCDTISGFTDKPALIEITKDFFKQSSTNLVRVVRG